jgi:hypothetical protein
LGHPSPSPRRTANPTHNWRRTVLAAVALGALVISSLVIGDYLWFQVVGRTTAFFVYLAWMAIILLAAAGIGSLSVRTFFPGYDDRLAAGRKKGGTASDDFLEIQRTGAAFQPLTVYFSMLTVVAAVGAMFIAQNLSGGALFAFKVVQLEAMSRSTDAEELKTFLGEIRDLQQPDEVIRFVEKLPFYYQAKEESVREAAFRTTEVMAHRMNLSVYLLEQDGQLLSARWEPGLLTWMHDDVGPRLRQLAEQGVSPMPALVAALARLARTEDAAFFLRIVEDPEVADATFAQAAIGLGNLALIESAPALIAAMPRRHGPARGRIFWALERIGNALQEDISNEDQEAEIWAQVEALLSLLDGLDEEGLCGTIMAIKAFQHSGATDGLIALFESPRADFVCPRLELTEPVGPPQVYIKEERLRWLLLNVLAEIGAGNGRLKSWVGQALNESYDERVMRGLRQLHGQLSSHQEETF